MTVKCNGDGLTYRIDTIMGFWNWVGIGGLSSSGSKGCFFVIVVVVLRCYF